MNSIRNARLFKISGLLLSVLVWLANSSNPTNGRTGAPFDGNCNSCHNGSNPGGFDGTVEITGMPDIVTPNTVYPLAITLTPTAGSPVRGGFQLVAVDGNNLNAGNLAIANAQTGTEMSGGREYIEHRGAKNFTGGGPASWNFTWTAPPTANGGQIKFYYIGNFTNNNGNDSGDRPIPAVSFYTFEGPSLPVSASISAFSNVTCNGASNGSITVEAAGGTEPYSYAWSNGQTTETAVNLAAGTYTVTVTGAAGSGTATVSRQITQPAAMTVTATANGTITCSQTTATVSASASGGAAPYLFAWSDGTTTQQAQVEQAGTYTVTVTDNSGCTKTATTSVSGNTSAPTATIAVPAQISCTTSGISLNGAGSSSGAGFTYAWTASNGGNIVSGASTLNPLVNACGTYTLTVTNTSNGCTATASRTVTCNTTPPQVSVTGGTLTCTNQSVPISASSTTPGATFSWTGPCITPNTSNLPNPPVCAPGVYTVTVTNPATGCTATASAQVLQDISVPQISVGGTAVLTCTNPTISLPTTVTPGTAFYTWSGACINPGTGQSSAPIICAPGTYTVLATNSTNGCTSTSSVTVQQNTTPPLAVIAPPETFNCNTITVALDGSASSPNAAYQWTTSNGNIVTGATSPTSLVDQTGTYRLVVTSGSNGCTAETSTTVVSADAIEIFPAIAPVSCFGEANGSIFALAVGGSGNYTYLWSTGATTTGISQLAAGIYSVSVMDTDGCSATSSATVTQPAALQLSVTATAQTAVNQNDGSATAAVSGGIADYSFVWSNGATTSLIGNLAPGTYSVTATDANGCSATQVVNVNSFDCDLSGSILTEDASCNGSADGSATVQVTGAATPINYLWSNMATTAGINNLTAGSYSVSLTDADGCPLVLTGVVGEPLVLTVQTSATPETTLGANDGTATALAAGGTAGYNYLWNTNSASATISNLAPGTYTVTVRDANGCSSEGSVVVPSVSCELEAELIVTPVKCLGTATGTAAVTVSGANGEITYQWNNGASSEILDSLAAGTVTVIVSDEAGCSTTVSAEISAPASALSVAVIDVVHVNCPSDQNGSAAPALSGGWGAPYTFQFSWGLGGFSNLPVGDYSFTVTDQLGCVQAAGFEIVSQDSISPALTCPENSVLCGLDFFTFIEPVAVDNCPDGALVVEQTAGLPSGSLFLDGVYNQVFSATDASGNIGSCSFTITVYPLSDVIIGTITDDFDGSGTGAIDVEAVGDTGPFTFEWEKNGAFFADTEDISGLNAGTYTLVMTDANGCTVQLAPITIDNVVGTSQPTAEQAQVKLLPNPAQHSFRLEMINVDAVAMEILNAQGRLVRNLEAGEWNSSVNVGELAAGFYYLKIVTARGGVQVVKWVKA